MKQAQKKGFRNEIGALGEQVAANYLKNKGFTIIEINYLEKWGEIDIVAHETNTMHFVEVKTVSYDTKEQLNRSISHETWRPEENVHIAKLQRIARTINSWIAKRSFDGNWQIDVVVVRLVPHEKYATVKVIQNVII